MVLSSFPAGMALLAVVLTVQAPPLARHAGGRFRVDAAESRVTVKVGKAGLFKFAGHEHDVSVLGFSGEVVADPGNLSASSVHLVFAAASLRVTGTSDSEEDRPKIQETMAGPTVLDVAHFPEIRFDSRTVTGKTQPDGSWGIEVTGDLKLRSAVRPWKLSLQVALSGDTLVASGEGTLRQTDFGITPVSVAGVVKVKDELAVEYRIVARKTP